MNIEDKRDTVNQDLQLSTFQFCAGVVIAGFLCWAIFYFGYSRAEADIYGMPKMRLCL